MKKPAGIFRDGTKTTMQDLADQIDAEGQSCLGRREAGLSCYSALVEVLDQSGELVALATIKWHRHHVDK